MNAKSWFYSLPGIHEPQAKPRDLDRKTPCVGDTTVTESWDGTRWIERTLTWDGEKFTEVK